MVAATDISNIRQPVHNAPDEEEQIAAIARATQDALHCGLNVAQNIHQYGITDQQSLVKILTICAADPDVFPDHIQNFNICNPADLFGVFKIFAARDGYGATDALYQYQWDVSDKQELIAILKIAVKNHGLAASFFSKDAILNQEDFIEIAKDAAAHSGNDLSCNIGYYGIVDKNALTEIAKISARQDGVRTSYFIQRYGITDKNHLITIAKIAAIQAGIEIAWYIQNYRILDQVALLEIAKIAIRKTPNCYLDQIDKFILQNQDPHVVKEFEKYLILWSYIAQTCGDFDLFTWSRIEEYAEGLKQSLSKYLLSVADSHKKTKCYIQNLVLLEHLQMACDNNKIKIIDCSEQIPEELSEPETQLELLNKSKQLVDSFCVILKHPNQKIKVDLCNLFIDNIQKYGSDFLAHYHRSITTAHLRLPMVILCRLELDSSPLDVDTSTNLCTLRTVMADSCFRGAYRNAHNQLQSIVLQSFCMLEADHECSAQEKISLLAKIMYSDPVNVSLCSNRLNMLRVVSSFFSLRYFIDKSQSTFSEQDFVLNLLLKEYLLCLADKNKDSNFANQFLQIDMEMRVPLGLTTYMLAIGELSDSKAIDQMQCMFSSIVNNTSIIDRYRLGNNKHLYELHQNNPEIFEKWKYSNSSESVVSDDGCEPLTVVNTDHWQDLFLAGTEVFGSCMHIHGQGKFNKCLSAYVMDGKNRMIAVKNSKGKIEARAILRLMQTNLPGQPALFLEKTYPELSSFQSTLRQFAIQTASALKLALYTKRSGNTQPDLSTTLHSLSSNCQYEYVDGGGLGIVPNGEFELTCVSRCEDL